jgi:hypothetical protein
MVLGHEECRPPTPECRLFVVFTQGDCNVPMWQRRLNVVEVNGNAILVASFMPTAVAVVA